MTNLTLDDMVAINQDEVSNHIGHLFWNYVGEDLYNRDSLENALVANGLEGFMPREIFPADAFRRATKEVETRNKIGEGKWEKFLVRDVASDNDSIERRIVKEKVNAKGRRLSYDPEAAILLLDKKAGTIAISGRNDTALELAYEASRNFEVFKSHYSGNTVRGVTQAILKTMSPVPVKPSGGIYFVPAAHDESLQKLVKFCSYFSKTEGFKVPVARDEESIQMVEKKVSDHLDNILSQCRSALQDGTLTKSKMSEIMSEAKTVISGYRDYETIISQQKSETDARIEMIKNSISLMFDRVEG